MIAVRRACERAVRSARQKAAWHDLARRRPVQIWVVCVLLTIVRKRCDVPAVQRVAGKRDRNLGAKMFFLLMLHASVLFFDLSLCGFS